MLTRKPQVDDWQICLQEISRVTYATVILAFRQGIKDEGESQM